MNKKKAAQKAKAKAVKGKQALPAGSGYNYPDALILLAYGFVTVLTPNLMTLDSLGPKFLSLALLNLITYIFFLSRKEFRTSADGQIRFFRTPVGLVYTLFMLVALLSFINAINIRESILNYAKLFTLFSAAYNVSVILRNDTRHLRVISVALSLLLIFDSFTVFYHVATSVLAGKGPNIYEIKSIYSNKNILSAALFVKTPFALWLLAFDTKKFKALGFFTVLVALLAILLMSTRAFYLGFIFMTIAFVTFMGIRYYRKNERRQLITLFISVGATIAIAFLLFSGVLKFLYPESDRNAYTVDFISRLKTISQGEGQRTRGWERTLKLIEEHPVLGVGTGNWKLEVLKYENLTSPDYIYMYKTHNDFLETTSETGIVGGVLFLSIFILIGYNFLRAFFRRGATEASYKFLFLPAFGLFAYTFDAFFNFPADRPEICSLFAIYTGACIAFSPVFSLQSAVRRLKSPVTGHQSPVTSHQSPVTGHQSPVTSHQSAEENSFHVPRPTSYLLPLTFVILLIFFVYILYLNFESLKLQRLIKDEQIRGPLTLPSEMFLTGFPWIPDINVQGEPIAVQKARYLINEKKWAEAIELLKKDHSSPYDTRPEFFMASAWYQMGELDSSLAYFRKVLDQKPFFISNVANMAIVLANKGNIEEANDLLDRYKDYPDIQKMRTDFQNQTRIRRVQVLYDQALKAYNNKEYLKALTLFTEIINREPELIEAYDIRSFCYYFLKEYNKSIADINKVLEAGEQRANLLNLRGVNYLNLGNSNAACQDFVTAMNLGNQDAKNNHAAYCNQNN